jgi:hypothetical protein
MKGYEYQSDFAKKYIALGRDQGRAEGWRIGRVKSVLLVLQARGIEVPHVVRERIVAEQDLDRLERWLMRAVVVASIAEVFDDPS